MEVILSGKLESSYSIRTISGNQEARLIYLGPGNGFPNDKRVLLMDIGGGSTEFHYLRPERIFCSIALTSEHQD
jgi:exopolyphosphatase/pppGpp-phosphohydrolase